MARNKYPEETHQKIVDAAIQLFMVKGYEKTSLNDIISQLGGLTKGAIYHHFKSKEDILVAVENQICQSKEREMQCIFTDKTLTAAQKLQRIFDVSLKETHQEELFIITPNLLDNPTFLSYYIKMIFTDVIPTYITPIMEQGVEDGSIKTEYPKELGELLMLMSDIWMNPLVLESTPEELTRKALLFNQMLEPFGLHLLTEEVIEKFKQLLEISKKNK